MQNRKDEIRDMMKTEQGEKFVKNACTGKRKRGNMTIIDPKGECIGVNNKQEIKKDAKRG